MHEAGIMESALRATLAEMEQREAHRLICMTLRIGEMAAIDPEALQFAFDALSSSFGLEGARMEVEHVDARARCPGCHHEFATKGSVFIQCPECGRHGGELLQGREIELARLEME